MKKVTIAKLKKEIPCKTKRLYKIDILKIVNKYKNTTKATQEDIKKTLAIIKKYNKLPASDILVKKKKNLELENLENSKNNFNLECNRIKEIINETSLENYLVQNTDVPQELNKLFEEIIIDILISISNIDDILEIINDNEFDKAEESLSSFRNLSINRTIEIEIKNKLIEVGKKELDSISCFFNRLEKLKEFVILASN